LGGMVEDTNWARNTVPTTIARMIDPICYRAITASEVLSASMTNLDDSRSMMRIPCIDRKQHQILAWISGQPTMKNRQKRYRSGPKGQIYNKSNGLRDQRTFTNVK